MYRLRRKDLDLGDCSFATFEPQSDGKSTFTSTLYQRWQPNISRLQRPFGNVGEEAATRSLTLSQPTETGHLQAKTEEFSQMPASKFDILYTDY